MGLMNRLFGAAVLEVIGLVMYLAIIRRGVFDALVSNGITVNEVVATVLGHPDVLLVAIVLAGIGLFGESSSNRRSRHRDRTDIDADADGVFEGDGGDGGGGGLFGGDGGGGFDGGGGGGGGGGGE